MMMQAGLDELPVPRAETAADRELYCPDAAPDAFTVKHPCGVEVREVRRWMAFASDPEPKSRAVKSR